MGSSFGRRFSRDHVSPARWLSLLPVSSAIPEPRPPRRV